MIDKAKLSKSKILLVINESLNYNYALTSKYLNLHEELRKKGFKSILVGRYSEDKLVNSKTNIIKIKPIMKGLIGNFFVKIQILSKVMVILLKDKKIKKVIIRNNDPELIVFLIPLIKILKRKVIYDFAGYLYKERISEGRRIRAAIIKPLERISLILSDKIILLSKGLKGSLLKMSNKKVIILPTGLSSSFSINNEVNQEEKILKGYGLKSKRKTVGFIGNWEEWVDIRDIIKCSDYLENILFFIVGEGYNSKEYYQISLNKKNIKFTGRIPHKEALVLLKRMDLVIVPYKKESPYSNIKDTFSSMKVKESLAMGKPIIVSDIFGKESFLKNYENCIFYKPNDVKDLSKKIRLILKDKKLYKKISKNSFKLSKKFYLCNLLEESGLLEYLKED